MQRPSTVQLKYWEDKLRRFKLSEESGRKEWLYYGHSVKDLDFDGRRTYKPSAGERLDSDREWPISLQ